MIPAAVLWLAALVGPPLGPWMSGDLRAARPEPPDVVWISGAWFPRGSTPEDVAYAEALCARDLPAETVRRRCPPARFESEMPAGRVWVSSFGIDRTEVTVAAWERCVLANRCPPSRVPVADPRVSTPAHPVAGVRWSEARDYCRFAGGRLPTEAEWERAARGLSSRRRWPWGRFYHPRLANHGGGLREDGVDGFRYAAPVGSFPDGASPHGLLDMAGNVWEWTEDRFDPESHASGRVDPVGAASGAERVLRGGSWQSDAVALRVTARVGVPEGLASVDVGFRCAYSARREQLSVRTPAGESTLSSAR